MTWCKCLCRLTSSSVYIQIGSSISHVCAALRVRLFFKPKTVYLRLRCIYIGTVLNPWRASTLHLKWMRMRMWLKIFVITSQVISKWFGYKVRSPESFRTRHSIAIDVMHCFSVYRNGKRQTNYRCRECPPLPLLRMRLSLPFRVKCTLVRI